MWASTGVSAVQGRRAGAEEACHQRKAQSGRASAKSGSVRRARTRLGAWTSSQINCRMGRRFRALTIVDVYTRESVAIEVGQSLKGDDVVRALNRLKQQRGVPKVLFCDNGSEFTSQAMDLWAYQNGVKIDFSRPGKPTDNAFVETFNGTFRDECLDTHWFQTLTEARQAHRSLAAGI